jgi:hypothetical protein
MHTTRNYSNYSAVAISTLYKSQQHPLSLLQPAVFTSRSLAKAFNSGDSSASCAQFLSSHRAELLSTVNSTIAPSLLSLPCRARLNSSPQLSSQPAWGLHYIASGRTQQKKIASKSFSVFVKGDCLAIVQILFTRERVYRATAQKRPFVYPPIAYQRLYSLSVSRSLPSNGSIRHNNYFRDTDRDRYRTYDLNKRISLHALRAEAQKEGPA